MKNKQTCQTCEWWELSHWKDLPGNSAACENPKIYANSHAEIAENELKITTPTDGVSCNSYTLDDSNKQFIKTGERLWMYSLFKVCTINNLPYR